jgi:hypothetical protein
MLVTVSAAVPVVLSVTVNAAAAVPTVWFGKVSDVGLTVAVVKTTPAVAVGICHTPRPYVPAVSTCDTAPLGVATSVVTGASGSPVPYTDQQEPPDVNGNAQLDTARVT